MGKQTTIEWTEATWNPVTGCTKISPGCRNCYAERMTKRLKAMGQAKYTTGFDQVVCHPGSLDEPLRWRKPRMVFVNSMSDLFHENVPFEFIDKVFAIMAFCPQHTCQVLTKRSERMADYFRHVKKETRGYWCGEFGHLLTALTGEDGPVPPNIKRASQRMRNHYYPEVDPASLGDSSLACPWPLPNVWLGTSAENQDFADKRIPELLRCPASLRFLSLEPLVGPVNLRRFFAHSIHCHQGHAGGTKPCRCPRLDWVIVGGESGPKRRPMKLEWLESVVDQCKRAGIPCFVKQDNGLKPGQQGRIPDELWSVKQFPEVKET